MQNPKILFMFGVLLALSQAALGADMKIKCYVCDNCDNVNSETPTEVCDAGNVPGNVDTTTTTELVPETTTVTTLTTVTTSTTSTTVSSTMTPPIESTTATIPATTESTAGPPTPTNNTIPTPSNSGVAQTNNSNVNAQPNANGDPPQSPLARRRRQTAEEQYRYNCYRVQQKVNGTFVTKRGCSRTTVKQSVCAEVEKGLHEPKKCFPCETTLCNGSTVLEISAITVLLAVVAALLRTQ